MQITIPTSLSRLKKADELESVTATHLARHSTAVFMRMLAKGEPLSVKIQGQSSVVSMTQKNYEEIVTLINMLHDQITRLAAGRAQSLPDDGFQEALSQRFDELVANMNRPGALASAKRGLFTDAASLSKTFRPGDTETQP